MKLISEEKRRMFEFFNGRGGVNRGLNFLKSLW